MTYLAPIGVVVSVVGAIIVALPDARLTEKEIGAIEATKFDVNSDLGRMLHRARRTARYGVSLIAVGTAIQMLGLALSY